MLRLWLLYTRQESSQHYGCHLRLLFNSLLSQLQTMQLSTEATTTAATTTSTITITTITTTYIGDNDNED